MSVVCLKTAIPLDESIHNGEREEAAVAALARAELESEVHANAADGPDAAAAAAAKAVSTDELALLAKLEEANRYVSAIFWLFRFMMGRRIFWGLVNGRLNKFGRVVFNNSFIFLMYFWFDWKIYIFISIK